MTKLKSVKALEVLDSRGVPTVFVEVTAKNGKVASAMIPSGASTGHHEAIELRDHDPKRFFSKGVQTALRNIEGPLFDATRPFSIFEQTAIDKALIDADGTPNKARMGANAILALSIAVCKLAAKERKQHLFQYIQELCNCKQPALPTPMLNILNGGAHANNSLDFQEFMIRPVGIDDFSEKIRAGAEIFHTLKQLLQQKGYSTNVGDEGGFAPNLENAKEALDYILRAIEIAGYKPGQEITLALDIAANFFYHDGKYVEGRKTKKQAVIRDIDQYILYLQELKQKYPIDSFEDPVAEEDLKGWKKITENFGAQMQIVGDDVFVTDSQRLQQGIAEGFANSILIKLNQIGTVSETIATLNIAKKAKYQSIISHRSGETEDVFIADFAVGCGCGQIKTGSLSRSERTAKYNRLLYIDNLLKKK